MMETNEILTNLGLTALSEMQHNAVELISHNMNAVLLAPTGSGKTLAFLLPLARSIRTDCDDVQAMVLSPTRELALQTLTVLTAMKTGIRAMCCYGGRPAMDEHRKMAALRPQVIIGTPGRLNDHIDKGNLRTQGVRMLVVDEFDKMFELKFQDEVEGLLGKVPQRRRCVLVSATDMEEIPLFAGFAHKVPAVLNWLEGDHGSVAEGISHHPLSGPRAGGGVRKLPRGGGAHRQLAEGGGPQREPLPWRHGAAGQGSCAGLVSQRLRQCAGLDGAVGQGH